MIDARAAAAYNASVRGKLWEQSHLPPPYGYVLVVPADGEAFAHMVSAFQALAGLTVDGKLGSDTLASLRSHFPAPSAPVLGDDGDGEASLVIPQAPTHPSVVGRMGVSNCLRIGGKSVPLPAAMVADGIGASNFHDDGEHRFKARKRAHKTQWFVIHESVSMSQKATIRTLEAKTERAKARGYLYGVHLICAPDGHLSCHADLADDRLTHASQLNSGSVGCEWVNPYNPKWAKPPFDEVIPGPWWCWVPENAKALYTVPTRAQLLSALHLCRFLPTVLPDLPLDFPTQNLGPGRGRIPNWSKRACPGPGIVAHRDFDDHADGRYILEHVLGMIGRFT